MDGESGDEGNDELTCVRSDESDKSGKITFIHSLFVQTDIQIQWAVAYKLKHEL